MRNSLAHTVHVVLLALLACLAQAAFNSRSLCAAEVITGAEEKLSFNRDIRPIFSDKCFACHGFDKKHRDSGRRLDTPEGAYAEKDGVIAIKPGDLARSDAWARITSNDKGEVMPPP